MGEIMRIPAVFLLLLAAAALAAAPAAPAQSANWGYYGHTGPLVWGKLDRSYEACSKGHEQSPVDIRNAHLDKALQPIEFHYVAGPLTLVNDGRTVNVTPDPGSYIVAGGVRYDLVQIHFHHPSEHAIRGKLTDLEVHLVHKSADGKFAVVAILFTENAGFPNATVATLWEHMPTTGGGTQKIADMVSPAGFLPADRGYWAYTGSLTEPPCTEGVQWFVFEQSNSISREQLRAFAALYKMNTRPLQDLHGRRIEADK
jgi:carbonic anhydrase